MNELDIVKAIKKLKPNSQFSFTGLDYSTINWDVLEGEAPTWEEVQAAHILVQQEQAEAEAAKEANRSATQAKLEALGLDEDDIRALGL